MNRRDQIPQLGLHANNEQICELGLFSHGKFEDNIISSPNRLAFHQHPYHEICLFHKGKGNYSADFTEHQITTPCAVLIPAGTVHRWPQASELQGDIIAFDLDFLSAVGRSSGPASILRSPVPVDIPLKPEQLIDLEVTLASIRSEMQSDCRHQRHIVRSHLSILLIQLRRIHDKQCVGIQSSVDRLYSHFLDMLEARWGKIRSPKEYARELNVSPDHLAATLKKACGKNTSELIQERLMLESKRQLAHSRLSISEIAYQIGYQDPSYFSRLFKKLVDLTPKQFREQQQKIE